MRPHALAGWTGARAVRRWSCCGLALLALLCGPRPSARADVRGEPCLTCRTDDCPTKPNIEPWCGEGADPLARRAAPAAAATPAAPAAPVLPLVDISSEPDGATVWVDDRELGKTPLTGVKLRRGEYRLRFVLPEYKELKWPVRVHRTGQQFLVTLQRADQVAAAEEPATTARIDIESQPQGATVRLDEKEAVGTTPLRAFEVAKGSHQLALSLRGYQPLLLDLLVQRDSERYVLTLRRPFCKKCLIGGLVGGAVVLGGVALTVGLLLRPPSPPGDIRDPVWQMLP